MNHNHMSSITILHIHTYTTHIYCPATLQTMPQITNSNCNYIQEEAWDVLSSWRHKQQLFLINLSTQACIYWEDHIK